MDSIVLRALRRVQLLKGDVEALAAAAVDSGKALCIGGERLLLVSLARYGRKVKLAGGDCRDWSGAETVVRGRERGVEQRLRVLREACRYCMHKA